MSTGGLRILDCACGIGTQTLGLAGRGHMLTGVDLSAAAIARAHSEAQQRGLSIRFAVGDMRDLSALEESNFDVSLLLTMPFHTFSASGTSRVLCSRSAASFDAADCFWPQFQTFSGSTM
jgi:2-polyprenyl-3-methyl-5-hydroxy-6-metoxy-1,4-benzoquinol methylase